MGHRGKQSSDEQNFVLQAQVGERMRAAVADMAYLLGRGYALPSALQLVGNRYRLNGRQQQALRRVAAAPEEVARRKAKRCALPTEATAENACRLAIDGYNVLIFLEAALSGGYLLRCADGCMRDISGIHGSYHSVEETEAALLLVARTLARYAALSEVLWLFDAPISNSGRLCTRLREMARAVDFPLPQGWTVRLDNSPDKELLRLAKEEGYIIATGDAWILDELQGNWYDLHADALEVGVPAAEILDFCGFV